MSCSRRCGLAVLVVICSTASGDVRAQNVPAAAPAPLPFQLRDGVVIDPRSKAAYFMSPDHGIRAVDLSGFKTLWTTKAGAKPLTLANGTLFAQMEKQHDAEHANVLDVVALDAYRNAKVMRQWQTLLPRGVHVGIDKSLRGAFEAHGFRIASDSTAVVTWRQTISLPTGMPPDPTEAPPAAPPAEGGGGGFGGGGAGRDRVLRGQLLITKSGDLLSPSLDRPGALAAAVATDTLAFVPVIPRLRVTKTDHGREFTSADGRHVIITELVADERVWEKYLWTVLDRATREKVGEMRSHFSVAPFYVNESTLIYVTEPFGRDDKGREPLRLRAVDLKTGREAWYADLRDTEYRGPLPP